MFVDYHLPGNALLHIEFDRAPLTVCWRSFCLLKWDSKSTKKKCQITVIIDVEKGNSSETVWFQSLKRTCQLSIFETSVFSTKALELELERDLNRQTIRISNKKIILAVSSGVVILLATCIGDICRKARAWLYTYRLLEVRAKPHWHIIKICRFLVSH